MVHLYSSCAKLNSRPCGRWQIFLCPQNVVGGVSRIWSVPRSPGLNFRNILVVSHAPDESAGPFGRGKIFQASPIFAVEQLGLTEAGTFKSSATLSYLNPKLSIYARQYSQMLDIMQWVETNPLNICFFLRTSIFTSTHGTMLTAYRCLYMDVCGC